MLLKRGLNNMIYKGYETVIGLEVHVELKTKTKIFCSCPTDFGAEPNTQCCPVCMGMPGTLPVLNRQVVDYAIKAGIATNCNIASYSKQDRKNYFYPDLPKAYQISQFDLPLCENGYLTIAMPDGEKRIGITRIHIEEDAGKLIHDDKLGTLIDCNRCGVPLIEIVSEPDLRSADEVKAYLQKLRAIILYTGISDCKMNEGSLRCDVNLSVRPIGSKEFGTRTEMKNLNSFQFIIKAIEYEAKRQIDAIEAGETIIQETRRFDEVTGKTFSMRRKEDSSDYRYFPDPDLPPIITSNEKFQELKNSIPELPDQRKAEYIKEYSLTPYDAEMLTAELDTAERFEQAAKLTAYPKLLANMMISNPDISQKIDSSRLASLAELAGESVINSSTAKKLMAELAENDFDPAQAVKDRNLAQINDRELLYKLALEAVEANPKSVADYKKGKKAASKAIVGQTIAKTSGRGNPKLINEIVEEILQNK